MSRRSKMVKLHSNTYSGYNHHNHPPTLPPLIRRRSCLIITTLLILVPFTLLILIVGPELSTEQTLSQRLAECHMRLQYLESMYRARQEDVAILSQYLGMTQNLTAVTAPLVGGFDVNASFVSTPNSSTSSPSAASLLSSSALSAATHLQTLSSILDALSPEARQLLKNASQSINPSFASSANLRLPTAFHFLPHLLDDAASLKPAFLQSKGRSGVTIVLGVPTVHREKQSYLLGTLQNLIANMDEQERNETLIIVFIGETDLDAVQLIAKQIEVSLEPHFESGLVEVIAPSPTYYPDFEKLRITLNDPLERVKWRSKQNLDFAYLMAYAQPKGTFYVQLEDDILAKRHFINTMKKYAINKSALTKVDQPAWFVLDFCQLGFIGKMFKSAELPYLITFFQMFYNDKPVDWLLEHFMKTKVCRTDKDQKHCHQEISKYWIHYKPSLFQHIGTSSSLKGKVQKLKDKQFGSKIPTFYPHLHNPPAMVRSNIAPYKNFQLQRAYRGETYFWGLLPQPGDLVQIIFPRPINVTHYLFRSGNSEHPSDRFYNTTVEVLRAEALNENYSASSSPSAIALQQIYNTTADGYQIVGNFDAFGVAEGALDPKVGAIKELRLNVHSDSENWALLSEIELRVSGVVAGESEDVAKKRGS